jgi:uncharacterized membrane protein
MAKQTDSATQEAKKPAPEAARPAAAGEPNDESRLIAAISYIFGILVSVIIFLLKKEDRYVKFHAAQAIIVDLSVMVLSLVVFVGGIALAIALGIASMGIGFFLGFGIVWISMLVFGLCILALRLFLAFQAYSGKKFGIPIIGAQAEKISSGE